MKDVRINVPPDKSISHRALLLAFLSREPCRIHNLSDSLDVLATLDIVRTSHSVEITRSFTYHNQILLHFLNICRIKELNCKNSGTTARHMISILSLNQGSFYITGDKSLSKRPMARIIDPMIEAGANIKYLDATDRLPLQISPSSDVQPIRHSCETASAQIKSSLMFGALGIEGTSKITLPKGSRDHTEKMFEKLGLKLKKTANSTHETIEILGKQSIPSFDLAVPGDPSSAAYLCALKLLKPDLAPIHITGVCWNSNRLSFLEVMHEMGLSYQLKAENDEMPIDSFEPTVTVSLLSSSTRIQPVRVQATQVASLVDELPLLIVLSGFAQGESAFEGLHELRLKESDRLAKSAELLNLIGRETFIYQDRIVVRGNTASINGFRFDTGSDHRMAMIAGVVAQNAYGKTTLRDKDCVNISFPNFWNILESICGNDFKEIHHCR